jgi:oryzin
MQSFVRFLAATAAVVPFLGQAAPVPADDTVSIQKVPGRWLVQLKPTADIASIAAHKHNVRAIHARNLLKRNFKRGENKGMDKEYGFGDFLGYSGSFDDATIAELKEMDEVCYSNPIS